MVPDGRSSRRLSASAWHARSQGAQAWARDATVFIISDVVLALARRSRDARAARTGAQSKQASMHVGRTPGRSARARRGRHPFLVMLDLRQPVINNPTS